MKLEGRSVICISKKYGNFTYEKEYPLLVKGVNTKGEPCDFRIEDDEGDYFPISEKDIIKRKMWVLK